MKVRAKVVGFYAGVRRRLGSVFEIDPADLGSWMEPLDNQDTQVRPVRGRRPPPAPKTFVEFVAKTADTDTGSGEELV